MESDKQESTAVDLHPKQPSPSAAKSTAMEIKMELKAIPQERH